MDIAQNPDVGCCRTSFASLIVDIYLLSINIFYVKCNETIPKTILNRKRARYKNNKHNGCISFKIKTNVFLLFYDKKNYWDVLNDNFDLKSIILYNILVVKRVFYNINPKNRFKGKKHI